MPHTRVTGTASVDGPRGLVLQAVRRGARTVNAIAAELRVTDNAVRRHLASLERDALVHGSGVVRSGQPGKPALEYEVTRAAEVALSRAYAPALEALVLSLEQRLPARTFRATLADAGRRLAPAPGPSGTVADRTAAAAALLESLGGSVSTSVHGRHGEVVGHGCPLAAAVARVPATCVMVRDMLAAGVGADVELRCAHAERPRCAFRIG